MVWNGRRLVLGAALAGGAAVCALLAVIKSPSATAEAHRDWKASR